MMTFNQSVTSCEADASKAPLRRLLLCCDGGIGVKLSRRRLFTGLLPYLISNLPEIILETENKTAGTEEETLSVC